MSNLIQSSELSTRLLDPTVRLVDTRFDLSDTGAGEMAYCEGHIPGAVYAHLDRDLSAPRAQHGGRHPLPRVEVLAGRLGGLGIGNEHLVIAYDANNGMFASRLWWLLRYLGHDRVKVLDGGIAAWRQEGHPVTAQIPQHARQRFLPNVRMEMAVDREYVLRNLGNAEVLLVDARGAQRYRGEVEPIDPRAGHIPSAVNLPFAENLIAENVASENLSAENLKAGRFKPAEELRRRFELLGASDEVIVYCGSGVSAAHDVLAMEEAGVEGVRMYHGSWSDWCSYEDSPVATGEEP
ncbi:MAG: sulfurtransferase [Trueperaceae bacterium]